MKIRVFISYAKINNFPPVGTKEGWVDRLEMELKNRLAEEVGRLDRFELWRDNARLNSFEEVGGQIADALRGTDIFLMVASRAYLESRWCSDIELPAFISSHFGRRIFCVKTRPVELDALPEQLREVLGFDFWEAEPGGYRTLGDPVTNAHEDAKFRAVAKALLGDVSGAEDDCRRAIDGDAPVQRYLDQAYFACVYALEAQRESPGSEAWANDIKSAVGQLKSGNGLHFDFQAFLQDFDDLKISETLSHSPEFQASLQLSPSQSAGTKGPSN
jgi:hypothetical protein